MYKLTNNPNLVIRKADNATIPAAANLDYQEYLAWLAEGNTPEPLPIDTPEQILAKLEGALDRHLDSLAKDHGYIDVPHILSYVDDENPVWDAEARAFKLFRSRFWKAAIAYQKDVSEGKKDIPAESELIDALPKFTEFLPAA